LVGTPADRWNSHNPGNRWIHRERFEATKRVLMARGFWPLEELDILDIGCGGGGQLARLLSLGANPARLLGIDLLPERVDQAPAGLPELDIRIAAARTFSLGPDSLDLIWLQTVFSAIRDDEILFALIDRIREMLRPGGGVVWYDFLLADPLTGRSAESPYPADAKAGHRTVFSRLLHRAGAHRIIPLWRAVSASSPTPCTLCFAGCRFSAATMLRKP
jgi:SAM-dependent methyltransferase